MRLSLLIPLLALAAACGGGAEPRQAGAPPPTQETTGPSVLLSGELEIPAAQAFGDPGFHEVLEVSGTLPARLGPTEGMRLVVSLRDAARPGQSCDSEHPLSGCATLDWSDFPDRPNVPEGGAFDNHVTLETASGPLTLFLSESGELAARPDPYKDG